MRTNGALGYQPRASPRRGRRPGVRRPIAVRPIGALGTFGGHHRAVSFQEEFRAFLARSEVEYDERYVWD